MSHCSPVRTPRRAALLAAAITVGLAALIAATLAPRADAHASVPRVAYVDVSVATLWTDPASARAVDAPALTNPAHIERWLRAMTVAQYLNLTSANRTQTQALYGARVDVLAQRGGWDEVAVPGQPTPKNPLGYPGWVPAAQLSFDASYGALQATRPFAEIDRTATAELYRNPGLTDPYLRASFDTRLPVIGRTRAAIEVAVPGGGSADIPARDATVYASAARIPRPTGAELVRTARLFLGRPYLWGGTSGFAFDCSGLTHTIYDSYGITIGRDADAQADFTGHGVRVARSDLRPGDIIFYATDLKDPSTIYHDAIYAGDGMMIEAYGAGVPIRITPVRFNADYWGAERYLH